MSIELKVVLAILATYRLTVLLCTDEGPFEIMTRVRNFLAPYTALLSCSHCTGVWCAMFCASMIIFKFPSEYRFNDMILLVFGIAGGQSFMESCLEKKWKILGE